MRFMLAGFGGAVQRGEGGIWEGRKTLFDWGVFGFRDFRYYRARIVAADDPDLVGRDALVNVTHCGLEYQEPQEA